MTDPQGQTVPAGCDVTTQKLYIKNGFNIWSCNNEIKASGKYLPFVWDSLKHCRISSLRLLSVEWSCNFFTASLTLVEKNCMRAFAESLRCPIQIVFILVGKWNKVTATAGYIHPYIKDWRQLQNLLSPLRLCAHSAGAESFSVHFIKETRPRSLQQFQASLRVHSHQPSGPLSEVEGVMWAACGTVEKSKERKKKWNKESWTVCSIIDSES